MADEIDRGNMEVERLLEQSLTNQRNSAKTSYSKFCVVCEELIPQARQDFFEHGTDTCVDCAR